MPNAVLDRLLVQRQEQITFIDQTLDRVEAEGRDLVDAETANLDAARQRIGELNAQIDPLEEFEKLRASHGDTMRALGTGHGDAVPARARASAAATAPRCTARAGEYVVDLIRARGIIDRPPDPTRPPWPASKPGWWPTRRPPTPPASCRRRSSARSST